jgi:hypothetical protein
MQQFHRPEQDRRQHTEDKLHRVLDAVKEREARRKIQTSMLRTLLGMFDIFVRSLTDQVVGLERWSRRNYDLFVQAGSVVNESVFNPGCQEACR